MKSTALLDVSVLFALLWPKHQHYSAAHRWFEARAQAHWATCPLTQLGFVRLASNPRLSLEAVSPLEAARLLNRSLNDTRHLFWADDLPVAALVETYERRLQGYGQVTDAYLLSLAQHHRGTFATFDRGVTSLVASGIPSAIELIAVR